MAERRDAAEKRLTRLMGHDLDELRREFAENRGERRRQDILVRALEVEAGDLREDLAVARLDLARRDLRELEQQLVDQAAGMTCGVDLCFQPLEATVRSVRSDIGPLRVRLSVGSDHGVEPGFQFLIRRESTPLARLVIERTGRESSEARVFCMAADRQIVEGDIAIRVQ